MKNDPWKHRTAGMVCSTCMWFVEKGELGRCRRHAPTMSGYPVVYPSDWCGDHKLDHVEHIFEYKEAGEMAKKKPKGKC